MTITSKAIIAQADEYHEKHALLRKLEERLAELKPTLIAAMGGAAAAVAGKRILTVTIGAAVAPTPDLQITAAMVGDVIPGKKGRASSTQLRVL